MGPSLKFKIVRNGLKFKLQSRMCSIDNGLYRVIAVSWQKAYENEKKNTSILSCDHLIKYIVLLISETRCQEDRLWRSGSVPVLGVIDGRRRKWRFPNHPLRDVSYCILSLPIKDNKSIILPRVTKYELHLTGQCQIYRLDFGINLKSNQVIHMILTSELDL